MDSFAKARGMRDILPQDEIVYKRILGVIEQNYKEFGFDPVSQPAVERLSVLEAKSGEGIKTEIFRIDDGELGLRFDLTVSLARLYSENANIPLPFKRYCIEKVWRREEPQYGRYREFIQADADILGAEGIECEAELIACAIKVLRQIEIKEYKILVNSRKLMTKILDYAGITPDKTENAIRIIDKLDKKDKKVVAKELEEAGIKNGSKLLELFENDFEYYKGKPEFAEATAELTRLFELLEQYGIKNYQFEPNLARGLGYYTGVVYEVKSSDKGLGTIAAGGRYDKLIGIYSGKDVPAVGISFGVDRIATLFKESAQKTYTDVVLINIKEGNYAQCLATAQKLRENGISVRVDLMKRNMRKQLDYASAIGAKYAGIIGDNEAKEGKIMLKNLITGEQNVSTVEEASKLILSNR